MQWEDHEQFCLCNGHDGLCTFREVCPDAVDPNKFFGSSVGDTSEKLRYGSSSWIFGETISFDQWAAYDANGSVSDPSGQFLQVSPCNGSRLIRS